MAKLMTSIRQLKGGNVLKSGDVSSLFSFEILDADENRMDLTGTGKVSIFKKDKIAVYQDVAVKNGVFSFSMGSVVATGTYYLEIKLDGHIFPSNNFKVKVKNSLNADSAIPSDKGPKLKLLADELRDSGLITGGSDTTEDLVNVYNLAKI